VTTSDRHARTLAETALRVAQQEGGGRIAHAFRFTSVVELRRGDPYGAIWLVGGRDGRAPFLGAIVPRRSHQFLTRRRPA
jgi:hypothetical protein